MFNFTYARYDNLVLESEQNDWNAVAKHKSKKKQTKTLVTTIQEVKLMAVPYKLKPPPNMPKNMKYSKRTNERYPMETCDCCGRRGHTSTDCYSRIPGSKVQWSRIPYLKPGAKPLTQKELNEAYTTHGRSI
jgi:hypothetical protein